MPVPHLHFEWLHAVVVLQETLALSSRYNLLLYQAASEGNGFGCFVSAHGSVSNQYQGSVGLWRLILNGSNGPGVLVEVRVSVCWTRRKSDLVIMI